MNAFAWLALGAALVGSLLGCRSSEARAREAEFARLGQAIDALRNAPNEAKAPLIAALDNAECRDAKACELKQTCVSAYRQLDSARSATAHAKDLLAQPDGGASAAVAAALEVNRAQTELASARELTERCATDQGRLLRESRAR
ncbi:MAG: hypothetical protein ACOY0T_11450 [Myxococcota bacterium]